MITHDPIFLIAGDDWQIDATLNDPNNQPLPISDPTQVKWTLLDSGKLQALPITDFIVKLGSGPGQISVVIPANNSTMILGGSYHDAFRVTLSGVSQTVLQGPVMIQADPFGAATIPTGKTSRVTAKVAAVRTAEWAYHQQARHGH